MWSASKSTDAFAAQLRVVSTTVQLYIAGVGSTLPRASTARTEKVCVPGARPLYDRGDVHAAKAPPSRLHSNDDPASEAANSNVADSGATPAGDVSFTVGGVASGQVVSVPARAEAAPSRIPASDDFAVSSA